MNRVLRRSFKSSTNTNFSSPPALVPAARASPGSRTALALCMSKAIFSRSTSRSVKRSCGLCLLGRGGRKTTRGRPGRKSVHSCFKLSNPGASYEYYIFDLKPLLKCIYCSLLERRELRERVVNCVHHFCTTSIQGNPPETHKMSRSGPIHARCSCVQQQ